jgi:hypothetical protein
MTSARELDWEHATISRERIAVPLTGEPDDQWLDRFYEARLRAKRHRQLGNLPHLQIELRSGELTATGIGDGEHDGVRKLLSGLVASANETGRHEARLGGAR